MDGSNFQIDLVYLWVDGSDPKWIKKRNEFVGIPYDNSEANNEGRYKNNDELKYSLRSVAKHAPWIRKIFIVTDDQRPDWLNTAHPKIEIIDHREIIPHEILPTFNATVIEYFLYRIPDLSGHFLFSNDDMFFNADLEKSFFFKEDGYPIVRLKRKLFSKTRIRLKLLLRDKLGQYRDMVTRSANLVEKITGKYYSGVPHHNIDAYKKADYQHAVENVFRNEIKDSLLNRTRAYGDLHRSAIDFYVLATGHAHLEYADRNVAARIPIYRANHGRFMNTYTPKLFCMNDNQRVSDADRERARDFLDQHFPEKSPFEK